MTNKPEPPDFHLTMKRLGYTLDQGAILFWHSRAAVGHWLSGTRKIPKSVLAICMLIDNGKDKATVERLEKGGRVVEWNRR